MAVKPALELEPEYKSDIERDTARQLKAEGIPCVYEGAVIKFTIPAREAKYHPDFPLSNNNIVIECKGRFGDKFGNGADVRHRLCLVKEQHPDLDIRILFSSQRASLLTISKKSKTTQGQWATDHGFPWAFAVKGKPPIPTAWIKEMKSNVRPGTDTPVDSKRPETASAREDRSASPRKRKVHHAAGG